MKTSKEHSVNGALAALAITSLAIVACKKDREGLFELNNVSLYSSAAEKDKLKTNQQFISILHTNIFQTSIGTGEVFELDQAFQSIGDKDLAREVLISNFFNESGVQLPTADDMNANIEQFIDDTYKRFFVRLPNEAERTWVKIFWPAIPS